MTSRLRSSLHLCGWRLQKIYTFVMLVINLQKTCEAQTLRTGSPLMIGILNKICFPDCQNGGVCESTCKYPGQVNTTLSPCEVITYCKCPPGFEGRSCEIDSCMEYPPPLIPTTKIDFGRTNWTATLTCETGYKSKKTEMVELKCQDGRWKPSVNQILSSDFLCEPICDRPLLNDGWCAAPNKYICPFPFGGQSCEQRVDKSCENIDGLVIDHGSIDSDDTIGNETVSRSIRILRCADGYGQAPTSTTENRLLCLEGEWVFDDGTTLNTTLNNSDLCRPICKSSCQNGGECVAPDECQCQGDFTGDFCETRICRSPKPKVDFGKYLDTGNSTELTCDNGYQLPNGLNTTSVICTENGWYFGELGSSKTTCTLRIECPGLPKNIPFATLTDVSPGLKEAICIADFSFISGSPNAYVACINGLWERAGNQSLNEGCVPVCTLECLNGGFCRRPDECKCPPNTEGDYCEMKKCDVIPVRGSAVFTKTSPTQMIVECENGTTFPNGEDSLTLECDDGNYQLPSPYPSNAAILECKESCRGKCLNGGICQSSGKCQCLPEYDGVWCENKITCDDKLPHVNNAIQRKISDQKFLLVCIPGHRLPGNKSSVSVQCEKGIWALEGYTFTNITITCQPSCEGNCSNHGVCVSPEMCKCEPSFSGSKCESKLDTGCLEAPPTVQNARMEYNVTMGRYSCLPGYELPGGDTQKTFKCRRGKWFIEDCACPENPPSCSPTCDPQCQNGGTCTAPNRCQCTDSYIGDWCQSLKPKECLDAPLPLPNSFIEISPIGSYIFCQNGYAFTSGAIKESIWCNNGVWSFSSESIGRAEAACYPVCSVPCQNNGKCVAPDTCQCIAPFTGPTCEDREKELCWDRPPKIDFATAQYSSHSATIKCLQGFAFQSLEETLNLTCVGGHWSLTTSLKQRILPPLPSCVPICNPQCLNGGYCVSPDTCQCSKGFYGPRCEKIAPTPCLKPPTAVSFSTIRFDIMTGQLFCDLGYRLASGYSEVDLICDNGRWVSNTDRTLEVSDLKCSPVCQKPCKNEGLCVGPDTCRCPPRYTGKWCQYLKCTSKLTPIKNSVVEYSENWMSGVARCLSGYRLRWGGLGVKFECQKGKWHYMTAEDKWLDLECHPVCQKPCVNGGLCVAPSICKCPEGFFGSQCQKRYSKTITGKTCQLPFRYRGEWYYGCTGHGYHRPWCATSTNAHNLITSWGVCVADLGMKKVVVTYNSDACVFPFTYRGHEYTGCIKTDRGRPWCATEVNSYNQIIKWGFCNPNWGSKIIVLTIHGETCDLPFEYQGQRYVGCVEDVLKPWCVTATSKGVATKHGYCMTDWGYHRVTMTTAGNLCLFPFVHKSRTFDSCFKENNSTKLKCAVKVDAAKNALSLEECIQYTGQSDSASPFRLANVFPRLGRHITEITTVRGLRCVLPFWYKNEQFTECTFKNSDKPWCATYIDEAGAIIERDFCPPNWDMNLASDDIPEVHLYNFSPDKPLENHAKAGTQIINITTVRGKNCSFPFLHNGAKNYRCVEDGFQRPWCATAVDRYLNVIESDHCPDDWDQTICPNQQESYNDAPSYMLSDHLRTENGHQCAIPFVYLGQTFLTCAQEDSVKAWCPIQLDNQGTPIAWEYCDPSWREQSVNKEEGPVAFEQNVTFAYTVCEYRRITRQIANTQHKSQAKDSSQAKVLTRDQLDHIIH